MVEAIRDLANPPIFRCQVYGSPYQVKRRKFLRIYYTGQGYGTASRDLANRPINEP
jgi:hypothetical protein